MFWDNFSHLCEQNGKKPNSVAMELNISSGSVTAWKQGRVPKWATLQKIAAYFGCSVEHLLGRSDERIISETSLPADEIKLLQYYRSLDEDDKITALGDLIRFVNSKKETAPEGSEAGADLVTDRHILGASVNK